VLKPILIAAGALFCLPSLAQSPASPPVTHVQTVNELAAVCEPQTHGVPRLEAIAYCQGFLTSAGQYHALLNPAGAPTRPVFCVPVPGPTIAESALSFVRWTWSNTRYARDPALDGLLRWAQSEFPCAAPAAAPVRPAR